MNLDSLREYCLSMPEATENVQWGADLVFKVGGKMFAVANLTPGEVGVSFKCTPETFAELVEQENIRPAAYAARYHWITLLAWDALHDREIRRLVTHSYELVKAKIPRKSKANSTRARQTSKVAASKAKGRVRTRARRTPARER